jgi:hypothetical protein
MKRGLMVAATVASFCVEDVGTRRIQRLTREELAARLDELRTLVHFQA